MIGTGRIARRGPDATILLLDQRVVVELLTRRIAPQFGADVLVEPLGKSLGEAVRQRFEENVRIVILVL